MRRTTQIILLGGMLTLLVAMSPADLLSELQSKFDAYTTRYPSVRLSMLFNQPAYAPGDTAWFSAWYMNDALQGIKGDHIVTLELFDFNGSRMQIIRFKVKNGRGQNQFAFRNDLLPGRYRLVAYTDWMKNFGRSWFFEKDFDVLSRRRIQSIVKEKLMFIPEGGKLVAGVPQKVLVTGTPGDVVAVTDGRDEAARLLLDSAGTGAFTITPVAGQKYQGGIVGAPATTALPDVDADGVALALLNHDGGGVRLTWPGSRSANKDQFLVVSSLGKITFKRKVAPGETNSIDVAIPGMERVSDLQQAFVLDASGNVLAQRVFLPSMPKVGIAISGPTETHTRQAIAGTLTLTDEAGNPVSGEVAVTAVQDKLFNAAFEGENNLVWECPLTAGRLQRLDGYGLEKINELLIGEDWNRIDWKRLVDGDARTINYPFLSQPRLTGQVVSRTNGRPAPDSTIVIAYLQSNTIGYEAFTEDGKFDLPFIFDFYDEDLAFMTLQYRSRTIDEEYQVIINKDSIAVEDRWLSRESGSLSPYGEYAFNKQVIAKSFSFFQEEKRTSGSEKQMLSDLIEEEFQGADYKVNLSDYVVFPTMEDLLREVLPFAQHRKSGPQKGVRLSFRFETSVRVYKGEPLYVIDGQMTKNSALFMALKPDNIISIKILNDPNKLAQLGRLGEYGVIFVEMKKQEALRIMLSKSLVPVVGLSHQKDFAATKHGQSDNRRVPDIRSTLYWSPAAKTDSDGQVKFSFFASDDEGPVRIVLRGLTSDGKPFLATKMVNVTYGEN